MDYKRREVCGILETNFVNFLSQRIEIPIYFVFPGEYFVNSLLYACYGNIIYALFVKIIIAHVKLTTCFFDGKVIY